MADLSDLIWQIKATIRTNYREEITGDVLQTQLISMLNKLNSLKVDLDTDELNTPSKNVIDSINDIYSQLKTLYGITPIYYVTNELNDLLGRNNDLALFEINNVPYYVFYKKINGKWQEIDDVIKLNDMFVIVGESTTISNVKYNINNIYLFNGINLINIGGSGDNIYKTSKPENSLTKYTVGGLKEGTNINKLNGKTFSYILDLILFGESSEVINPTYTNPSLLFTFIDGSQSKQLPVGSTDLPKTIDDFIYSYDTGKIYLDGEIQGNYYGEQDTLKPLEISINGGEFSSTPTWIEEMKSSPITYKLKLYYNEGDQMLNSDGSVFKEAEPAGSIESKTITINPIIVTNKICYYGNDDNINSGSLDTITNKQQIIIPDFDDSNEAITEEFILPSEVLNNKHQCFAIPSEYDGKFEIQYFDIILNNWVTYKMPPKYPLEESIYQKIEGEITYEGKKYFKYSTIRIEFGKIERCRLKFTK